MTSEGVNEQASDMIDLTQLLGMEVDADGLLVGKRLGFPVGLKVTEGNGAPVLLFHVRYLGHSDSALIGSLHYSPEVADLIANKKLDIEFDDRLAWLTFLDATAQLQNGSLPALLDSVLASFVEAGLGGNDDLCHYCRRTPVEKVYSKAGRVAQICAACLAEKQADLARKGSKPGDGAVSIAILAPVSGLAGAVGWSGCWIAYELIFEKTGSGVVVVPRIAEAAAVIGVALITGGPIGLVLRLVRRRGQALSMAFAVVCAICAIVLGEVLLLTWLIYHIFKVLSFDAAWRLLPKMEGEMGIVYFALKLMSAVIAVVLAAQIAKPPRPKLAF